MKITIQPYAVGYSSFDQTMKQRVDTLTNFLKNGSSFVTKDDIINRIGDLKALKQKRCNDHHPGKIMVTELWSNSYHQQVMQNCHLEELYDDVLKRRRENKTKHWKLTKINPQELLIMRRRSSKLITTGVVSARKTMVNIQELPSPKLFKKPSVPALSHPIQEEDGFKQINPSLKKLKQIFQATQKSTQTTMTSRKNMTHSRLKTELQSSGRSIYLSPINRIISECDEQMYDPNSPQTKELQIQKRFKQLTL